MSRVGRQHDQRERAAHLRDRLDDRVFHRRRPRAREQVQDDFGVARRLEDRSEPDQVVLQLLRVDQVAVVRDRDLPVRAVDEDRLRVGQAAVAGRGVARVADGGVPGERGQALGREDVGDIPHVLGDDHAMTVRGGDAGALLPAVLHRVEAEVRQVAGLGVSRQAEDGALVVELIEHGQTSGSGPRATGT